MAVENAYDKGLEDPVKLAVLRFLGDNTEVRQQFLSDLKFPTPPVAAPEVVFESSVFLRELSLFFYGVFASLVAAVIFHKLTYKRDAKKHQAELEVKLTEILRENQARIVNYLDQNNELRRRVREVNFKKIYVKVKPGMKKKWEVRFNTYSNKLTLLLKSEEATELLLEIFSEITADELD